MIKIAFCCPYVFGAGYGHSHSKLSSEWLLDGFKKTTPNGDGIWEDLIGVSDVYDADWIVAIEDMDPNVDMSRIDQNKIILCERL